MTADPPEQFEPVPGWPGDVVARRVGGSYQTAITKLDLDSQGRVWLLRSERASRDADGVATLERYSTDGVLEQRVDSRSHSDERCGASARARASEISRGVPAVLRARPQNVVAAGTARRMLFFMS